MQLIRKPFSIIRANLRVYLILNAVMYGLALVGFGIGLLFPHLTEAQTAGLESSGQADIVRAIFQMPWLFALGILGMNILRLSLVTIVLPSMVIPFAGILAFAVWSVQTGVTLVPTTDVLWVALIPHSLTVVIELQAYILLALGAFLLGKYWLRPQTIGAKNRRQGYVRGLKHIGLLAIPAVVLLVIGAFWEAYSLAYLVHPLSQWIL